MSTAVFFRGVTGMMDMRYEVFIQGASVQFQSARVSLGGYWCSFQKNWVT